MKNLSTPQVDTPIQQQLFRVTLMNTKRSSYVSLFFLVLPFLFLSGVVFKHYLNLDIGFLTSVYEWISKLDHTYGDNSVLNWIIRFLLVIGPIIAMALSLMGIIHVRYESDPKELILSLKIRWLNLSIIIGAGMVFAIFFLYLLVENVH